MSTPTHDTNCLRWKGNNCSLEKQIFLHPIHALAALIYPCEIISTGTKNIVIRAAVVRLVGQGNIAFYLLNSAFRQLKNLIRINFSIFLIDLQLIFSKSLSNLPIPCIASHRTYQLSHPFNDNIWLLKLLTFHTIYVIAVIIGFLSLLNSKSHSSTHCY